MSHYRFINRNSAELAGIVTSSAGFHSHPILESSLAEFILAWTPPPVLFLLYNPFQFSKEQRARFAKVIVERHKAETRKAVEEWLEQDAKEHTKADGTSTAGRYYKYMKKCMEGALKNYPKPFGDFAHELILTNQNLQDWLRSEVMIEQFKLLDRIIYEHRDEETDYGLLYGEQYNHKFLSETKHTPDQAGKIVVIEPDEIVKLFAKSTKPGAIKGKDFPHVIITFSHAQGETLDDVTEITHGIQALARDSSKGEELPLGFVTEDGKTTDIKPEETLIIFACDVEKNPLRNAIKLLERVLILKEIGDNPDTEFKGMSRGAERATWLMLKSWVEGEHAERINVNDPQALSEFAQAGTPITLRADAAHVANHIQIDGYSKAGQTTGDAGRHLVYLLTSTIDDKPVFQKHSRSPTRIPNDYSMSPHNVSNIMRGITFTELAAVDVKMAAYYIQHGVRRAAMNNKYDTISAHQNYADSPPYDQRWIVEGTEKNVGHAPTDMMGTRHKKGFLLGDKRAERHMQERFSSNYGKVAIGHVHFDEFAENGRILLEAATGTTEHQLMLENNLRHIRGALERALWGTYSAHRKSPDIIISRSMDKPGRIIIECKGCDFSGNSGTLKKLKSAFETLLNDKANGIVITRTIVDEEIPAQIAAAKAMMRDNNHASTWVSSYSDTLRSTGRAA